MPPFISTNRKSCCFVLGESSSSDSVKVGLVQQWKMHWIQDHDQCHIFIVDDLDDVDPNILLRCHLKGLSLMTTTCMRNQGEKRLVSDFQSRSGKAQDVVSQ